MCAIAGQYSFTGRPADRRLVRAMARRMGLRGPDGEGFHFHGRTGLAHKRLSILDLETGGQPMRHPSGRFTVVCNGEIYNYLELREELEAQGHRFETRSDTEVILHLYERYGAGCLERLEGMFAFCLYDQRKDALLLARDPFGVKPLHYYHDSAAFLFSSELKGLFAYAGLDRSVDGEALRQYFNFLYVLEPGCIFKNVRKVPPGHYLWVDRGGVRLRRYYDPKFFSEGARRPEGPGELREALAESVRLALRSDVPLGLFLSGGIDSSAVAALAARERPRMDSFSVAFRESPYDERRFSRMVAARLGTRHHELEVTKEAAAAAVPKIAAGLDEPFADSSFIPTYFLSRLARMRVKAVLTGDGNDELFAGYGWHTARSRGGRDARALLYSPDKLIFEPAGLEGLFSRELRGLLRAGAGRRRLDGEAGKLRRLTTLERRLYLDLKYYLPSDMLVKVDRMTMMNSLEARVPMLNRRYADHVCALPPGAKLGARGGKALFRRAFRGLLPREILTRDKMGFAIPMDVWLWGGGAFRELVYDTLSDARTRARGLLDQESIGRMRAEHDSLARPHGYRLWTVFMFEMWLRSEGGREASWTP